MSFWDDVNNTLDKLVKKPTPQELVNDQGLVEPQDMDQTEMPYQNDLESPNFNPDSIKQALVSQGYMPTVQESPYQIQTPQILDVVSKQPSPFTVADLTPANDNGQVASVHTAVFGTGGVVQNRFPASQSTLQKIATMLNMPIVGVATALGGVAPAVTYQLGLVGNSLRVERLPQGYLSQTHQTMSKSTVLGAGPPTDVALQDALSILLSGCYIQFESTDAPIFLARPGETYNVSFSTLYVTVFGSGGRFRIISGNNASIAGISSDRNLRSDISVWDGGGLLDNPMIHPVPFAITQPLSQLSDGVGGTYGYAKLITNYDDGANITVQAGTNALVGTVLNKGYVVGWITGIAYNAQQVGATADTETTLEILKIKGKVQTVGPNIVTSAFPAPLWSDKTITTTANAKEIVQLAKPIRFVLAGFDQQVPAIASVNPKETGESLIAQFNSAVAFSSINVSVQGYLLGSYDATITDPINFGFPIRGSLLPFNPYAQDVWLEG